MIDGMMTGVTKQALPRRAVLRAAGLFGAVSMLPAALRAQGSLSKQEVQKLFKISLKPAHPRLHLDADGWQALRDRLKSDDELARQYGVLRGFGDSLLTAPVAQFKLVGPRLLTESRRALETISTLAGLFRLSGDPRYAERARHELAAICAFPSWHPPHFLDVAEMTNAAGLGYDWLYDVLTPTERQLIRGKIIEYGLRPGLELYQSDVWWSKPFANNWGQVCGGGLTVGALAVANDANNAGGQAPEPADILRWTIGKVPNNMLNYAPDGGWPEGPGYWAYATNYTCVMISVLESSLGRDFNLSAMPGFSNTGAFRVASIGPSGLFFNYADSSAIVSPAPEMIWLAHRFNQPLYLTSERDLLRHKRPNIFHLIWAKPVTAALFAQSPPLDVQFTKVEVAYLRTSWTDANAFFCGVKGGNNAGSHAHLDLGSFVLDALGQRWALDLGPDDYDLPDYFGKLRWDYYRMRTEGHNTLTRGGASNQVLTARAPLIAFTTAPQSSSATVDLTAAYAPACRRLHRTVTLQRASTPVVVLQDVAVGDAGTELRWHMHTDAVVKLSGPRATLMKGSHKLLVTLESPAGAVFQATPATAPPPQAQQKNVTDLFVDCKLEQEQLEIRVTFRELMA